MDSKCTFYEGAVNLRLAAIKVQFDLLMRILTEVKTWNISGNDHHGGRIKSRIGHSGDRIGHARPHMDQNNPGLVGHAEISICCMGCYLLMSARDEFYFCLISQSIQQCQGRVTA